MTGNERWLLGQAVLSKLHVNRRPRHHGPGTAVKVADQCREGSRCPPPTWRPSPQPAATPCGPGRHQGWHQVPVLCASRPGLIRWWVTGNGCPPPLPLFQPPLQRAPVARPSRQSRPFGSTRTRSACGGYRVPPSGLAAGLAAGLPSLPPVACWRPAPAAGGAELRSAAPAVPALRPWDPSGRTGRKLGAGRGGLPRLPRLPLQE